MKGEGGRGAGGGGAGGGGAESVHSVHRARCGLRCECESESGGSVVGVREWWECESGGSECGGRVEFFGGVLMAEVAEDCKWFFEIFFMGGAGGRGREGGKGLTRVFFS